MTRLLPVCFALCLVGCEDGQGLSEVRATIDDVPSAIDFGDAYVGMRVVRPLELRAEGARIAILDLRHEGEGFTVGAAPAQLLPGQSTSIELAFTPIAAGTARGALSIFVDANNVGSLEVALSGEGLPIPDCDDRNVCTADRFDLELGQCAHDHATGACDDRSACTEGDTCSGGVCVGRALDCGDGNDCTRDLCDPAVGCVPLPDDELCADADLCTVDRCGARGCEHSPAPEGSACGTASICRDAGVCRSGSCDRPTPALIEPEWSVPGRDALVFPGLVDDDDNLYWLNCPHSNGQRFPCSLVSVTAEGVPRFEVATGRAQGLALLTEGLVIVAEGTGVEARLQSNGDFVWSTTLPMGICNGTQLNPTITSLAADGRGCVLVGARGTSCAPSVVHRLEAPTGGTNWTYEDLSGVTAIAADERGNSYVISDQKLLSLDPLGETRWTLPFGPPNHAPGLAVANGLLWTIDETWFTRPRAIPTTGGSFSVELSDAVEPTPIISGGLYTFLTEVGSDLAMVTGAVFDPTINDLYVLHPLPNNVSRPPLTQPELTSRGTIVFVEHHAEPRFYEYARTGELLATCPLYNIDGLHKYGSAYGDAVLAILDGRIVLGNVDASGWGYTIKSFAAPDLRPARAGWTGARGSRARDNRPR